MNKIAPLLIASVLLLISCQDNNPPTPDSNAIENYIGHWRNLNLFTDDLTRMVILKQGDKTLSIELIGECIPGNCQWGSQHVSLPNEAGKVINLLWKGHTLTITQEISIPKPGKLEVTLIEDYDNDDLDTVKVYTFSKIKAKTLFDQIKMEEAVKANLSRTRINGSQTAENRLTPGSILLYQTSSGKYGKMQIRGNAAILTLRWHTWNADGSAHASSDYMATRPNGFYDMNEGVEAVPSPTCHIDFLMDESSSGERWLTPQCKAAFMVYHVEPR